MSFGSLLNTIEIEELKELIEALSKRVEELEKKLNNYEVKQ